MGFKFTNNLKSKLAASVAILATVFSVLVGVAPAHATASSYTPNTGSNWGETSVNGKKVILTPDTSGTLTGTQVLADASTFSTPNLAVAIPSSANTWFADGAAHSYDVSLVVRDSANKQIPFSATLNSFQTGTTRTYVSGVWVTTSSGPVYNFTLDPSATNITMNIYASPSLGSGQTLPAGTYSWSLVIKRDGVQIPGSKFSAVSGDNVFTYGVESPNQLSVNLPGDQSSAFANVFTCLDTAHIAVNDSLTLHPILDGSDVPGYSISNVWNWVASGSLTRSYNTTLTATSEILTGLVSASSSISIGSSPISGTHTVGLSIFDTTANREVSAACVSPTPTAAPVVTSSPLTDVSATLGTLGTTANPYPNVIAQILDSSNNVIETKYTSGSTISATSVYFSVANLTGGQSYTVRYQVFASFYNGTGPASAWSPSTSFTAASVSAPTATQSSGTVTLSVSGGPTSGSAVGLAYLASNPSIAVASTSLMLTPTPGSYSGTFLSLTPGSSYTFAWCLGFTMGASYNCSSAVSPQTSTPMTIIAPTYGYTPSAVSGAGTVGAAQTGLAQTTYGSGGTFSRGSDGSNGFIVGEMGSGSVTIKHFTPTGQDTSFGTGGTITVSTPGVMFVNSLNWTGNRDKWELIYYDNTNLHFVVGDFSGTILRNYVVNSSPSAAATVCNQTGGYSSVTSGSIQIMVVPNPNADVLVYVSCTVNLTYADSSTGAIPSAYLLTKLTGDNTFTTLAKLNAANATENKVIGMNGSTYPVVSTNPTATGSQIAVVFGLAVGAAPSNSGVAPSLALKFVELKADGTLVTVSGGSMPSAGGMPTQTISPLAVNDGVSLKALALTSGSPNAYVFKSFDLAAGTVANTSVTFDTVTGFTNNYLVLPVNVIQSEASGSISVFRYITTNALAPRYAAATLNLSTGALTTQEAVAFTTPATSPTYNWFVPALDASSRPALLYTATNTKYASIYWRTTAASSGPSTDATATFTVNGTTAHNGDTINVSNSSTSASVIVTANESHATVGPVTGSSSLAIGNNTVSFTVTAQDGTTTQTYTFTVVRAAVVLPTYVLTLDKNSSSATGSVSPVSASAGWTVPSNGYSLTGYSFNGWNTLANGNGTAYAAGASISLSADTTLYAQWLIDPFVLSFDANTGNGSMSNISARSGWTIPGTVGFTKSGYLFAGWNTAANRSGTAYNPGAAITLTANQTLYAQWDVLPSDAVLCAAGTFGTHGGYGSATSSWTCDPAPLGSYVSLAGALSASQCPAGYFAAVTGATSCTPAQSGFFVATPGASAQVACPGNWISDAAAIICHSPRELSHNTKATFSIGGKSAANGGVIELTGLPSSLGVLVNLADNRSSATISVPANPVIGNNTVTVFVYAEDGSVQESNFTVHIAAPVVTPPVVVPPTPKPSSDATATIKANGSAITDGATINLAAGTTSVSVAVTPTESHATYSVSGASALATGSNAVTVTVTAQDGTKKVYSFTAVVAAPLSTDATATITVAGIKVADGDHVNLPFGTSQVAVLVTPTESHATYVVSGATGLNTGTSALTVTVTAQDGTTKTYSFQLVVAADTTPVNVTGAAATALDRVKAALAAGRVAVVTFAAKGAAAHTSVVNQIRAFKASARASGITGRISFTITDAASAASAVVRVG